MWNGKAFIAASLLFTAINVSQASAECSNVREHTSGSNEYSSSQRELRRAAENCRSPGVDYLSKSGFYVRSVCPPHDTPGSIPGEAIAARQAAPPASTAPEIGLFSTLHNVER